MSYRHIFSFAIGLLATFSTAFSQSTQNVYSAYINQYKGAAIEQMQKYGIPASITLSQGLLESAAGQSRLARKGNNHFGIKATSDWTGDVIKSDDETKNEEFRKYRNVEQSYEDHSQFLLKPRYSALFELDATDYKGWAKTLKKCGYATNPNYANSLIDIIERYDLAQYDRHGSSSNGGYSKQVDSNAKDSKKSKKKKKGNSDENYTYDIEQQYLYQHQLSKCNDCYYIVVQSGDDLKSIARATGRDIRNLRRYNDIPKGYDVQPGQRLFLTAKSKSNTSLGNAPHIVKDGESMHSISQLYGVKMEQLYKINSLSKEYMPRVGDRIYLSK